MEASHYRNNYTIHKAVTIDFGVIPFGVLILLIVGIITIGSQTFRASTVSPVDNLRNE